MSDIATKVDAGFTAPTVNPVMETVVIEPSVVKVPEVAGLPLESAPLEGANKPATEKNPAAVEIGGTKGPDPTRYGDWEHKGRCYDF